MIVDVVTKQIVYILSVNISILILIKFWKGNRKYLYVNMGMIILSYVIVESVDYCVYGSDLNSMLRLLAFDVPVIGMRLYNVNEDRKSLFFYVLWATIGYCIVVLLIKFIISMIK